MDRHRHQRATRFTKRLEARFKSGGLTYTGILSNFSQTGLFVRTNRGFTPGTAIDIELVMPNNEVSVLKGVVRRTIKTQLSSLGNGMGVELIEKDSIYSDFVKSFCDIGESKTASKNNNSQEFKIISCPNCGVKNKVANKKLALGPKCGKCGTPLSFDVL
jgi:Tfp pilus assembly protein PilZ/ribosomal protein S27AE